MSTSRVKTILVPVDFSRTTAPVVAFAAKLARGGAARLMADRAATDAIRGDSLEMIGKPAAVILEQASRLSVDYIVMGAHRPTHRADKRLGRTAGKVIRDAACPVILVPAPRPLRRVTA